MNLNDMMSIKAAPQSGNAASATNGTGNGKPMLPPRGAYPVRIFNVGRKELTWGTVFRVQFDISDGEHLGYFAKLYKYKKKQFEEFGGKEPNFRGHLDFKLPLDNQAENFQQDLDRLMGLIETLNASNTKQLSLSSDEQEFKGLDVFVMLTHKTFEIEDRAYEYIDPRYFLTPEQAKEAAVPNDRKSRQSNGWANNSDYGWNAGFQTPVQTAAPSSPAVGLDDHEGILSDGDVPF